MRVLFGCNRELQEIIQLMHLHRRVREVIEERGRCLIAAVDLRHSSVAVVALLIKHFASLSRISNRHGQYCDTRRDADLCRGRQPERASEVKQVHRRGLHCNHACRGEGEHLDGARANVRANVQTATRGRLE
eukprot:scaffold20632_cov63-Phaeocystis_antarctica.AAC.6